MASPMMTPPPPRSLAGPVVLILVGVVALLATMGLLNRYYMVMLFARYWPLLLILAGLIKLIEYEQAKRTGLPARGIGVGGAFLIVFLIMIGLTATGISHINWPEFRDHFQIDDQDWTVFQPGSTFDYSDDLAHEFPTGPPF